MMTEALLPSAVSANTSGAILLAGGPDIGKRPWPTAPAEATTGKREEAIAPMAATAVAIRNSEQKIRRHRDDVNVDLEFGFVVIELPVRLDWLLVNRRGTRLYPKGQPPVKLILRSLQTAPWETLSCEVPLANNARLP